MKSYLKQFRTMGEGMRQDELAYMTGVSRETINRIERGKNVPRLDLALRIANTLSEAFGQEIHVDEIWKL